MIVREIVKIDEEKCNGCGLCTPACAEGALQLINGKAKLVNDKYCDGLGACLGECPQGAITIEKRKADEFDEAAVQIYLKKEGLTSPAHHAHSIQPCPSTRIMHFERNLVKKESIDISSKRKSMLSQWPVQLTLLPPSAPFFENADLLIAADCVPFAYANFHSDLLKDRTLVIGCPKLDDTEFYKEKLTQIFKRNNIKNITVVNMEVPCCFGLHHLVKQALDSSGKNIPLKQEIIGIKGDKISTSMQRDR